MKIDIEYTIAAGTIILALVGGLIIGSTVERARLQKGMEELSKEMDGEVREERVAMARPEPVGVRWVEAADWDRGLR